MQNSNNGGINISGSNNTIGGLASGTGAQANNNSITTSHYYTQPEPQVEPPRQPEPTRVLFVFANPRGTDRLLLDMEWRAIQEALRLSNHREQIESHLLLATTADDLRRKLLEMPFHIVHVAGHSGPDGLVLEDAQGRPYTVAPQALAECFKNYRQTLRCVLLNSCYSPVIGQNIVPGIPLVIVLSGSIEKQASIVFARGFYDALGAGNDPERAYIEGMTAIRFANLDRDFLAIPLRA
ncbi:MAG TPA: CHAT domain-containing protein [Ktedonobacteraceae bacterium]